MTLGWLNAEIARFVEHRNEADDTAVSPGPAPWEEGEGAPFAGYFGDVATDVFDA